MKDWKTWVLLIGVFFLIKTCGGCEGCSDDSDIPEQQPTTFTRTCHRCGKTFETHHKSDIYCHECYEKKSLIDEMNKTERQRHGYAY